MPLGQQVRVIVLTEEVLLLRGRAMWKGGRSAQERVYRFLFLLCTHSIEVATRGVYRSKHREDRRRLERLLRGPFSKLCGRGVRGMSFHLWHAQLGRALLGSGGYIR